LAGSARASEAQTPMSRTAVTVLVRPSRLRMLEDCAAMHARDKGVGDAVLVAPSAGAGRTN
jgi:hypothetical protein